MSTNHYLHNMTRTQLSHAISVHEREVQWLKKIDTGCGGCNYLVGGHCNLWDAPPPSEVIPVGCEQWVYDEIPF